MERKQRSIKTAQQDIDGLVELLKWNVDWITPSSVYFPLFLASQLLLVGWIKI